MIVGPVDIEGFSLGGIETCVRLPRWNLAIDVGRGRDEIVGLSHLALTHTHMDHAGGLPYVLALRQLFGMKPPKVYVPDQMADALQEMLQAWPALQRYPMSYELVRMAPGDRHELRKGLYLEAFRTYHPVPSVGYSVIESVEKLKPELHGTEGSVLAQMKRDGRVITDTVNRRLLSVTGDTLPEVIDKQPQILESEVLLMECTFLDASKPKAQVKAGGHVHLDDLLERADKLTMPELILSHMSQIHAHHQIPDQLRPLAARIPGRLHAFPTAPNLPWQEVEVDRSAK